MFRIEIYVYASVNFWSSRIIYCNTVSRFRFKSNQIHMLYLLYYVYKLHVYNYRIRERRSVLQMESRLKKRNNIARTPRTDKKMSIRQMRSRLQNVGLELGANASDSASAPQDDSMTGTSSATSSAIIPVQFIIYLNCSIYSYSN